MHPTARPIPGTQIPCYEFRSNRDVARHVAQIIANTIGERNSFGRKAVLGLATGSTPKGVYRELIRMHQDDGLDFSGVVTFNLDEYQGLSADRIQSYHRWMQKTLFEHVNVKPENIHIPDGSVSEAEIDDHCRRYEDRIRRAGGIDLQLLGIGRNGHIGFNEPFSPRTSRTRCVSLGPITRRDASPSFFHEDNVPRHAITMGIDTIFDARKILLMAFGEHKAKIVREAVEGPMSERVPASLLREHHDAAFLLDTAAAAELTDVSTPWLLGSVEWTDATIKRAMLWLCEQTDKALLKLDNSDFRNHELYELLEQHGPAQKVAHRVFKWMMETIEYHPAGRERSRVLCFSPHPDDDVISMGGSIIRSIEDEHEMHIAYMTSGNIAVFDHDAQRFADLLTELNRRFEIDVDKSPGIETRVLEALATKQPGDSDTPDVLKIKEMIRWSEAKSAAQVCGCREECLHFLDLPFYQTGTIDKRLPGPDDVAEVLRCLETVRPARVFVAGDLSDPHGTHRVCAGLIFDALRQLEQSSGTRPEVLLYRGAWQEWPLDVIEVAVPLSPRDVKTKKQAIFRHESQKDSALFPGADDPREFWQRAEERNRHTADMYNRLGLPEYYAMEAFVRWDGKPI